MSKKRLSRPGLVRSKVSSGRQAVRMRKGARKSQNLGMLPALLRYVEELSGRPAILGVMVAVILVLAIVAGLIFGQAYNSQSSVFLAARSDDPIGVMAERIASGRDPLDVPFLPSSLQGVSSLAEPEIRADQWRSAPQEDAAKKEMAIPEPFPGTPNEPDLTRKREEKTRASDVLRKPGPQSVSLPPSGAKPSYPAVFIAVVIDDMGVDPARSRQIINLPGPLTTSFLTFARELRRQAKAAAAAGHELMMHMPMEPKGKVPAGPDALLVHMAPEEITARVRDMLGRMDHYVGVNNHQGSKFTENAECLRSVMSVLKERGLFFLDSRTSGQSIGSRIAEESGVQTVERSVFIDHEQRQGYVAKQLALAEALARKNGHAIAIGHPRDVTITELGRWLPTLPGKGITLVPVSTLVNMRYGTPAADLNRNGKGARNG